MNRIFNVLAVFSVVLVSLAWGATTAESPTASAIEIVKAEFGLFNLPESGKPPFVPATTVPLENNQGYGWVILIKTNEEMVKWREEFTLPAPPETWAEEQKGGLQTISPDKRTCVTERQVKPANGIIYNTWTVVPGDPKGHYIIRVTVEGKAERTFEFDVK